MRAPVIPGAEAWSHVASADEAAGVLVVHGFTGTPASVSELARAAAAAGHHVEVPRLPGHGTVVDDMLDTRWPDWTAAVVEAHDRLAARSQRVVAVGQSMGATLVLWLALQRPDLAGLVCINPPTRTQSDDVLEMLDELLADGMTVVPGSGSDIADPASADVSYDGTPVAPLLSLQRDGLADLQHRYGELRMPLRLFTSRQDHVVAPEDSEHLAASWGGEVHHTWLERSYHVATRDFDRDLVTAETVEFVGRVLTVGSH